MNKPRIYIEEINTVTIENYHAMLDNEDDIDQEEYAIVGAGIAGGFGTTTKLDVMKFKMAMKTEDKEEWLKAVDKEHERMVKHNVWKSVDRCSIQTNVKVLISTWATKKKANRNFLSQLNAKGYKQID
jgi:hypothetical protein